MRSNPLPFLLLVLLGLFGGLAVHDTTAQDASPATTPGASIEFVESSGLDLTIPQGDTPATVDITLRNLSSTQQTVTFCFLERTPNATCADSPVTVDAGDDGVLAPNSVSTVRLTITQAGRQIDLSGYLVATIDGQAQAIRPITLTHETFTVAVWHILAASLLVAVVFTASRKVSLHGARKRPIVDNPSLKGWATAVTVATGIGAPLLKELLGGESTILPGGEFAILGVLFALMIFIAPMIYGMTTNPADSNTLVAGESTTTPPIMGTWRLFWLSIALSVWAFTGTALTVALFIADAWDAGTLSFPNAIILAGACLAVFAILAFHAWRQIDHITSEEPLSTAQLVLNGVTDIQSVRVIVQPHVRHRFSGL